MKFYAKKRWCEVSQSNEFDILFSKNRKSWNDFYSVYKRKRDVKIIKLFLKTF